MSPSRPSLAQPLPIGLGTDNVRPLPAVRDDLALVQGLRAGEAWARGALFDRCAPVIERTLRRILGPELHTELADLINDTLLEAIASLGELRDGAALVRWVQVIAAHTAHRHIRSRRARRWLSFWEPSEVALTPTNGADFDAREACRRTYAAMDALPADERIAFALRFIEGMELTEVAAVCEVSLATIKRRLARAEKRFVAAAGRDPVLRTWLEGGQRWSR